VGLGVWWLIYAELCISVEIKQSRRYRAKNSKDMIDGHSTKRMQAGTDEKASDWPLKIGEN
jgi:hypothetical protein